jgi:hypothetical protein
LRQLTLDKVDSTGVIPRVQGEFDASTNSHPLEHPRWRSSALEGSAPSAPGVAAIRLVLLRVLADEVEIAPDAEALEDFRAAARKSGNKNGRFR